MRTMLMALALAGAVVAGASAQTATNLAAWTAPVSVTAQAAGVRIRHVGIAVQADGTVRVTVAWEWVDSAGKVVRNGVTRYNEAEIAAKLAAKGWSIEAFRAAVLAIAAEEATAP